MRTPARRAPSTSTTYGFKVKPRKSPRELEQHQEYAQGEQGQGEEADSFKGHAYNA